MDVRYLPTPEHTKRLTTQQLRDTFLVADGFKKGAITLTYAHADRMIIGAATPTDTALKLTTAKEFAAEYFHERRESGIFNIGGRGIVTVDGKDFTVAKKEMVYIGRGSQDVSFGSDDATNPARFFIISTPAHADYPTVHIPQAEANEVPLGSQEAANVRTIYQYIHEAGVPSCQLVMGFTELQSGSVWNTMPAHTHDRRSEVYMYFDLDEDAIVFHFMGEGQETRHLVLRDGDAVISPSWSIHAGAGISNYCFIWAMGGENQAFTDMDDIALPDMA